MRNKGWPKGLRYWLESFLNQRNIRVRYKGEITEDKEAEFGVL